METAEKKLSEDMNWNQSDAETFQLVLKDNGKSLAKLKWKNLKSANAKVEIDNDKYFFASAGKFFSPLICLTKETETEATCKITFNKWFDKTSGEIEFKDKTKFKWQFKDLPQLSFSIKDKDNNLIIEYSLHKNKSTSINFNKKYEESGFLELLIVVGWYLFPRFYISGENTNNEISSILV
jgi:hypothetical protein